LPTILPRPLVASTSRDEASRDSSRWSRCWVGPSQAVQTHIRCRRNSGRNNRVRFTYSGCRAGSEPHPDSRYSTKNPFATLPGQTRLFSTGAWFAESRHRVFSSRARLFFGGAWLRRGPGLALFLRCLALRLPRPAIKGDGPAACSWVRPWRTTVVSRPCPILQARFRRRERNRRG
jgi:hypothetical protein